MILECDIGNTRCKWRLLDTPGMVVGRGSFIHDAGFAQLPELGQVARVRVASVAADSVLQLFHAQFSGAGIVPEFAQSTASVAGVVNAYAEPQRLGVDRWLAVVAAYHRTNRAVLVIDAGSALTIDLVSATGRHLGGYIVPGAEMMITSLLRNTGQVRYEQNDYQGNLSFGDSTARAVGAGVLSAQLGSITVALAQAKRQVPTDFAVILTGGSAASLKPHLDVSVELVSELVLDGLQWLLP